MPSLPTTTRLVTRHAPLQQLTRPFLLPSSSAVTRNPTITNPTVLRLRALASSTMDKDQSRGESTTGLSEWKKRAPYRVHEPNDNFKALYEANCHCGKVKYQISRKEPLDSKLCHCTTCQTQHGMSTLSRTSAFAIAFNCTSIGVFSNRSHTLYTT